MADPMPTGCSNWPKLSRHESGLTEMVIPLRDCLAGRFFGKNLFTIIFTKSHWRFFSNFFSLSQLNQLLVINLVFTVLLRSIVQPRSVAFWVQLQTFSLDYYQVIRRLFTLFPAHQTFEQVDSIHWRLNQWNISITEDGCFGGVWTPTTFFVLISLMPQRGVYNLRSNWLIFCPQYLGVNAVRFCTRTPSRNRKLGRFSHEREPVKLSV